MTAFVGTPNEEFKGSRDWNKIYFDLTNRVQLNFVGFQIFVGALHTGSGEKKIYFDNIKVAYFDN